MATDEPTNKELLMAINQVKTDHDKLYKQINGNGQPGLISRVDARLDGIETKLGRVVVAVAVLSATGGGSAMYVAQHLF